MTDTQKQGVYVLVGVLTTLGVMLVNKIALRVTDPVERKIWQYRIKNFRSENKERVYVCSDDFEGYVVYTAKESKT